MDPDVPVPQELSQPPLPTGRHHPGRGAAILCPPVWGKGAPWQAGAWRGWHPGRGVSFPRRCAPFPLAINNPSLCFPEGWPPPRSPYQRCHPPAWGRGGVLVNLTSACYQGKLISLETVHQTVWHLTVHEQEQRRHNLHIGLLSLIIFTVSDFHLCVVLSWASADICMKYRFILVFVAFVSHVAVCYVL